VTLNNLFFAYLRKSQKTLTAKNAEKYRKGRRENPLALEVQCETLKIETDALPAAEVD
jgi:hypothetical protein